MNEARTGTSGGLTRFGLSRAALRAAIVAELEQAEDGRDPAAIASAVAAAIEANNQELLRQLNQMQLNQAWTPAEGLSPADAEDATAEP
ncbi:MAG TPA: hypothetical protein VFD49_09890 [Candidatus Dormibacteraeota bacterium]|nr:hypothetical protein [Candidatus Dormibacteraeota bacterium]